MSPRSRSKGRLFTVLVMAGASVGVAVSAAFRMDHSAAPLLMAAEVVRSHSLVADDVQAAPVVRQESPVVDPVTHEPIEHVSVPRHEPALDAAGTRWFTGRPIRPSRTLTMVVTAYSPDERSCGDSADGITASGYSVWTNGMNLVAADTALLPFGSMLSIPGYDAGEVVPVLDRGGAIKGHRLDVLFPTHEEALAWGVRTMDVTVWEYADGQPNGFKQSHGR